VPEKVVESRNWNDYLKPALERGWSGTGNKRFGTTTGFLNRFAAEIAEAFATEVTNRLRVHFVAFPVRPSFTSSADALAKCASWIDTPDSSRLMLVTGDAGAGKSVFSLMALQSS
jgi:UDP-N-acetylglucosamine:LPS N-acetylglucosamine transferase